MRYTLTVGANHALDTGRHKATNKGKAAMNIFDPDQCTDREFYTEMFARFKSKALAAIAADNIYDAQRYLAIAAKCQEKLQAKGPEL